MIPMKLFGRFYRSSWTASTHALELAQNITFLNRARTNGLATEEGAGVQPFLKLGELVSATPALRFREN
jgi:hypothetical protein